MAKTADGTEIGGIGRKSGSGKLFWIVGGFIALALIFGAATQLGTSSSTTTPTTSTQSGIDPGASGSSGSSGGNGIQTGPAITETPGKEKTGEIVKSSPITPTEWIKAGPEKSFFSVDDLKISVTVYQNIAIYTDKPTGNYVLDTKITLRNIKSGQEFRTNYEIPKNRLGGIAETPIDLNGNAKEWEWKVEFVKK